MLKLYDYQKDAVNKMQNGCILNGSVGSGKSLTSLYFYYQRCGGHLDDEEPYVPHPVDLYIITTAQKRDKREWDVELSNFLMFHDSSYWGNKVVVDSWNNITKYTDVKSSFFIFDEQRVVGKGTWVKSFLKITKANQWILLSATPGDTWLDYVPVFLANGFYKNRTEFNREHVIFSTWTTYPKVDRYINITRLERLRNNILVDMDVIRPTKPHHIDITLEYDKEKYINTQKEYWNPYTNEPITNASELCYTLRKIVNSNVLKLKAIEKILEKHPKIIIFYNYDYELDDLKRYCSNIDIPTAEWNGHKHQEIPDGEKWVYLVQYTAGAEGWNCIKTNCIIFYSENYSYKIMTQAAGRIDRINTKYVDLYYYHIKTSAPIDIGIRRALKSKKKFNEKKFAGL